MEATPLVDTYRRYKAGTQKLLRWLSDSAQQATSKTPTATKRPKPVSHTHLKKLKVDELVQLAVQIVAADPTIEIPIDILDITHDVIKGRKFSCKWYSALTASKDGNKAADVIKSNSRHQHFLGVLEKVYEILRKELKSRRPKRKKKIELATDADDLTNLYLHLELEELASDDEATQAPTQRKPKQTQEKKVEKIELDDGFDEDGAEEQLFALYCHLQDLCELRMQTRKVWQDYLDGRINFLLACQIFDQAVSIAFMLAKRFEAQHPDISSFDEVTQKLGIHQYVVMARESDTHECFLKSVHGSSMSAHDVAIDHTRQFQMMPAWSALDDVRLVSAYVSDRAMGKDYGGRVPASVFPGHPFAKILLQITADLRPTFATLTVGEDCPKCLCRTQNAPSDMYSRELGEYMFWGKMTTGLVTATTLYMDLYDALGEDLDRGLREAEPFRQQVKLGAAEFIDFYIGSDKIVKDCIPTIDTYMYNEVQKMFDDCVEGGQNGWRIKNRVKDHAPDAQKKERAETFASIPGVWPEGFVPKSVLRGLPVSLAQSINVMLHETLAGGLSSCNAKTVVLAAAHLYHATKLIGASSESWEDMDFVVGRENEVAPFVFKGDGSVNNAATQFCLAMGFKIKQLAGKGRPKFHAEPKGYLQLTNISRFVPEASGISDPCSTRHRHMAAAKSTLVHKKGVDLSRLYSAIKVYAKTHGMQDPEIAKQWKETRKLSTSQLLIVIQEILVGDDVYLHFDLHHFYINVLTFMNEVREQYFLHPSSKNKPRDLSIAAIVNEILWDAGQVEKAGGSMTATMLSGAGEMFDVVIPLMGAECITKARQVASGYIPEDQAPSKLYGPDAVALVQPAETPTLTVKEHHMGPISLIAAMYEQMKGPSEQSMFTMFNDGLGLQPDHSLGKSSRCLCCIARAGIKFFKEEELEGVMTIQQSLKEQTEREISENIREKLDLLMKAKAAGRL